MMMNQNNKIFAFSPTVIKLLTIFVVLHLTLACSNVYADDVKFTATAKTQVRVGENFQLRYNINAEGSGFRGPNITDFQVLSGPNTSTSSSVQIINGKVTSKVNYVFSYVLRATREGTFTVPAAEITVDGKRHTSNSLTIRVVKGTSRGSASRGQTDEGTENDLFLRAHISNSTPYLGEQVIITYKIYTTIPVSNIDASKISSFPGFWAKDLFQNLKEYPQTRQVINGQEYVVADVRKFAIFPQRSGEIIIEPGILECVAQIRSSSQQRRSSDPFFDSFFNDPFFNKRYKNVEKQLFSNSLKIDVKPLPTQNKPAGFSGAVGDFNFKSEISETEVKANEPITLKFTLSGKGNIELIDPPAVDFPPDFEVYDPEITNKISARQSGVSGTRTFEYLIIPRNPGDFTIKPVGMSYFDASQNKYVNLKSPEYNIKVTRGDHKQAAGVTYSSIGKEEIQYIGEDIRHIKLPPYELRRIGMFFFRSDLYFILLIVPVVLTLIIVIVWRRTVKRRSDVVRMKTRKATKISRKRLKKAHQFMKDGKESEFYVEISRALWGYLSDKLNIRKAELSMDNVREVLNKRKVNKEITDQFIETLNNTEFARFAPGDKSENMDKIYREALDIISKIERELK